MLGEAQVCDPEPAPIPCSGSVYPLLPGYIIPMQGHSSTPPVGVHLPSLQIRSPLPALALAATTSVLRSL